jgi:hypothetical protein
MRPRRHGPSPRAREPRRREAVYDIGGNHDRSDVGEPEGWWVDSWLDPTGSHTEQSGVIALRRPFQVHGTWERYSLSVGNLRLLMMSDRNDPARRLPRREGGGNPGGVVSGETFRWWRDEVERYRDAIIVSAHHYVLKETTVASGEWEGCWRDPDGTIHKPYHGYKPRGTPRGASYLYLVDGVEDAQLFERYLAASPGGIDLWLGGHTHAHPDDTAGGRSHVESRWGAHFINASALTRHHAGKVPMSRVLTLTPGSDRLRVRCYLHTDDHAARGFYPAAERTLRLSRPFRWS